MFRSLILPLIWHPESAPEDQLRHRTRSHVPRFCFSSFEPQFYSTEFSPCLFPKSHTVCLLQWFCTPIMHQRLLDYFPEVCTPSLLLEVLYQLPRFRFGFGGPVASTLCLLHGVTLLIFHLLLSLNIPTFCLLHSPILMTLSLLLSLNLTLFHLLPSLAANSRAVAQPDCLQSSPTPRLRLSFCQLTGRALLKCPFSSYAWHWLPVWPKVLPVSILP